MLYSTRERITKAALDFLSKTPEGENKKQCERDIHRIGGLFVEKQNIGLKFLSDNLEYDQSQDKFEFARSKIEAEAKNIGVSDKDAKYFSFLMTHLCAQSFYFLRAKISLDNSLSLTPIIAEHEPVLRIKVVNGNALLEVKDNLRLFYEGCNSLEYAVAKTIKYTFYPDKTMQFSMKDYSSKKLQKLNVENQSTVSENCNKGEFENLARLIFTQMTSMSNDNNDPFNLLAMNCDQTKCEKATLLVNNDIYQPEILTNEKINDIYLRLDNDSKTDPHTMADLIYSHIKPTKDYNEKLSNELYNTLSTETKNNIEKIAEELQKILDENGMVLEDTILEDINIIFSKDEIRNIIINCFFKQSVEIGEVCLMPNQELKNQQHLYSIAIGKSSSISDSEKIDGPSKFNNDVNQKSKFTQKYLEAKNKPQQPQIN